MSALFLAAAAWHLLTQTQDGRVSLIKNIESERVCQEMVCQLKWHATCEAHQKGIDVWIAKEAKAKAEWLAHNSCPKPTSACVDGGTAQGRFCDNACVVNASVGVTLSSDDPHRLTLMECFK